MTRRFRLFAAVYAFLHLMVVGLGPIADARLEAEEPKFAAHLESERSRPCSTGHDPLFCQLCQVIAVSGARSAPVAVINPPAITHPAARELSADAISRGALHSHGPRAPPVLSA
jgi:hypothetical protein